MERVEGMVYMDTSKEVSERMRFPSQYTCAAQLV